MLCKIDAQTTSDKMGSMIGHRTDSHEVWILRGQTGIQPKLIYSHPLPPLPSVYCLSNSNSRIEVKFKNLHIGVCVLSLHHTKYFMTMFMHKNLSLMLDYG